MTEQNTTFHETLEVVISQESNRVRAIAQSRMTKAGTRAEPISLPESIALLKREGIWDSIIR